MTWFHDLRIRAKLLLGFGSVVALLLAPAVPNVAIGPDVESTAKPVDAPIKTVIVFSDRAKIIRHGQAELGAGVTVLRLPDLPPAVSPTGLVAKIAPPARILRVEAQVVEREALELEQEEALMDRFVHELPVTVTGKPQKFLMRDAMMKELGLSVQATA